MIDTGRVLIVCAVAAELDTLAPRERVDVIAVGVGPVEAARGVVHALAAQRYAAVVNAGIGGGFRARASVGDAIVISVEHYVELGLEDGGTFPLPGGVELERIAYADAGLLALARTRLASVTVGTGITSATVTSTDARARALTARFDAHVESMEGFAVLRAAAAAAVPAIEVRGISNIVGDRAAGGWDFRAGAHAAVATADALLDVLIPQ
jgi:futalosine hydrolase